MREEMRKLTRFTPRSTPRGDPPLKPSPSIEQPPLAPVVIPAEKAAEVEEPKTPTPDIIVKVPSQTDENIVREPEASDDKQDGNGRGRPSSIRVRSIRSSKKKMSRMMSSDIAMAVASPKDIKFKDLSPGSKLESKGKGLQL
jgi:hypothetical protein